MRLGGRFAARLLGVLSLPACWLGGAAPSPAADPTVAVLIAQVGAPAEQAMAGFRQALRLRAPTAAVVPIPLGTGAAAVATAVRQAQGSRPHVLLALGEAAVQTALGMGGGLPTVAGLVPRAEELLASPRMTGVTLEFPLAIQLQWLRRVLPQASVAGVAYNPAQNRHRVELAAQAAERQGLRLEAREVGRPRDIPAALEILGRRVDVLWGLEDAVVLTPQTAREILLFSYRNRIPFLGPSRAWVEAGALFALDWDFEDVGAQCAEMVGKLLEGMSLAAMPVVPLRTVHYVLNQRTASHLRLTLPEPLLRGARALF